MKPFLKNSSLLFAAMIFSGSLMAQSLKDTAKTVKPFAPLKDYRIWSVGIHGGALSNYTIFHGVEDWRNQSASAGYGAYIKVQLLHSLGIQSNFVAGQLKGNDNAITGANATKYQTDINYAGDLSAVLTLANINWKKAQGGIQPYLSSGAGIMVYRPATYDAAGVRTRSNSTKEFFIPVGSGIKFNVSKVVNIDIGYQVNFVNGDNVDGNITGSSFDKVSYAHIGLEFALGRSSKPQLATHNPVATMRAEYTAKETDLQNQIYAEKAKTESLQKDLGSTKADLTALNTKFTADADADGVPDFFDKCPGTPAGTKVDGSGCPLTITKTVYITDEDKKVVKDAISNLEFDLGKATIRQVSFESLNKVADLLVSKNFSLKLAGHTDNVGSDALNLKLSKDRAEAIKLFLVAKGANPSRIEAIGYGEMQPIASNKTAAGRQQNRRVEFTLY